MSESVTVLGPNLPPTAHGETFHVHAAGCADIRRYGIRKGGDQGGETINVGSLSELARYLYDDQIEEGSMDVDDAISDIWLAPCVRTI